MIRTNRFFASLSLGLMLLATVSCAKAPSTSQAGASAAALLLWAAVPTMLATRAFARKDL